MKEKYTEKEGWRRKVREGSISFPLLYDDMAFTISRSVPVLLKPRSMSQFCSDELHVFWLAFSINIPLFASVANPDLCETLLRL